MNKNIKTGITQSIDSDLASFNNNLALKSNK